ncbi:MAG: HAD hydrolase family protein [Treponema sp.]|jgi:Cof subfamily protein (haloacid dehalogenase superfamily)|nr:HAD hydrolase family protein [Treponema sp.]
MRENKIGRTLDPRRIRALALDLDGTCLRSDLSLGDRTVRALTTLADRGFHLILCTGRAPEAAEKYRAALGIRGPQVYFNGAVVADMPGERILALTLQDRESAAFCVELARKTGLYVQIFFPGIPQNPRRRLMAERRGPEWERYLRHTGIPAEIGDLQEVLANPALPGCVKTMFIGDGESQNLVRPALEERYGGGLYIADSLKGFLEIMSPQVSKGRGLQTALAARSLDPSQVIAFGDEETDLPLFAAVSYAAAPANAKDPVRRAADQVIGPHDEDPVAAFVERYFLK